MTRSTGQRRHHFKNTQPTHPDIKPYGEWLPPNRNFYVSFRRWLKGGGYGEAALNVYSVAARMALGLLDKPYWTIDPLADLETVQQHLNDRKDLTTRTKSEYNKGLLKFVEFIHWHQRSPQPPRQVNWDHYTGSLPAWLTEFVRSYHAHRKCSWPVDRQHRSALDLLSRLTASLRWMCAHFPLETITDLTPQVWFAYVEHRLANDIKTTTINYELSCLLGFLRFLAEEGQPVCERIFRMPHLEEGWRLPKDVPISQLKLLLQAIRDEATSPHGERRRNGLRDHAWALLMLHCGLRTCEVRRMKLDDIDWERRLMRIEQSKGLKDRHIWLTEAVFEALQAYLAVRGPVEYLPRQLFVYRHKPLSRRYCDVRLRTYGKRCGVKITPHQLRHSCATLLLNAGAPVTTVQAILGHKHVDTTMKYARLYDGTVAQHYYQAMEQVEGYLDVDVKVPLASTFSTNVQRRNND